MNIKELSQNYDITPHTLRYYEKIGLLTPEYGENGYRNYSYQHIERLNTIRDLRSFDIPLAQIKAYLDTKNSALTKEMLSFERTEIQKKIKQLQKRKALLIERIELINEVENQPLLEVEIKKYPERKILLSETTAAPGKDLYLELKKLHKQYEAELNANNQNVFGTILSINDSITSHQVFYCLPDTAHQSFATTLPAGDYATICYSGTYKNRAHGLECLTTFLKSHHIDTTGAFYEFYLLDFHETNDPEEYVTRIEIQVI
ncbi:MerR family transcriptional regulator [Enterococcus sp. DIV0876]|uniref:MerR family transcriptional regulator n=1 Tax=Enterococcus sp. DIV0876 TaxID=2774633 RepID=UPI003D2FCC38